MNNPQMRSQARDYPFSPRGQMEETGPAPEQDSRQPMVMEAMGVLLREIEQLRGTARHLQERLQPVLRKETQPPPSNGGQEKQSLTPCDLAAEIARLAAQVHESRACMDETLHLLEI